MMTGTATGIILIVSVMLLMPLVLISGFRVQMIPGIGETLEGLLPRFITQGLNLKFFFGGTALLIVVGVYALSNYADLPPTQAGASETAPPWLTPTLVGLSCEEESKRLRAIENKIVRGRVRRLH